MKLLFLYVTKQNLNIFPTKLEQFFHSSPQSNSFLLGFRRICFNVSHIWFVIRKKSIDLIYDFLSVVSIVYACMYICIHTC